MPGTDRLGPLLATILGCVERNLSQPVGLALVPPGNTVAWDACCEGQLWVRLVSLSGSSALSNPARQPCQPIYQARIEVGVLRCAHTLDNQGNPPTAAEMTADALTTLIDFADVVQALACCVPELTGVEHLLIEGWLPLGPDGGCVGGAVTATFNYDVCQDCGALAP